MATVTLNRATKVLRADLTDAEFGVMDALIQSSGPGLIEAALAYIVQSHAQEQRHSQKERLMRYVEVAKDIKLAELSAIADADKSI